MTRHESEALRRAQILTAARDLLIEKGYAETHMDEIAHRAGLSKGAVYFYYPSKRAVLDALLQEATARTLSFLDAILAEERPTPLGLAELGRRYLEDLVGLETHTGFLVVLNELAIRDPEVRSRVHVLHQRFVDDLALALRRGMDAGLVAPVDPVGTAMLLKALLDGLAGQAAVGIHPDLPRLAGGGLTLLLQSLSPPGSLHGTDG